jgi:predicted tellurium resistance membrane protein TerC
VALASTCLVDHTWVNRIIFTICFVVRGWNVLLKQTKSTRKESYETLEISWEKKIAAHKKNLPIMTEKTQKKMMTWIMLPSTIITASTRTKKSSQGEAIE